MSPGSRAAVYARLRERLPQCYEPQQKDYLESFEQAHGAVTFSERNTGRNSKGTKEDYLPEGAPIMETYCTSYNDREDRETAGYYSAQSGGWKK